MQTDRKAQAVSGVMKGQTIPHARSFDPRVPFHGSIGAFEQFLEPQMSQTQEAFVITVLSIKAFGLSVMSTTGSQMGGPPEGHTDDEQPAIEVSGLAEATAFHIPATTLGVLKGGL